jgi:hypothetical protein
MATKLPLAVEMEDGKTYKVVADQRDIQRYELQPFAGPISTHTITFMRFAAWSALERTGVIKRMDWNKFNESCLEVSDDEVEENEVPKA